MICLFVCLFFFMLKLLQYCNYIISHANKAYVVVVVVVASPESFVCSHTTAIVSPYFSGSLTKEMHASRKLLV